MQSQASSLTNGTPPLGRSLTRIRTDPNVVVLDKFEDVSPPSASGFSLSPSARRPSIPDGFQYLSLTSAPSAGPIVPNAHSSVPNGTRDQFLVRFRHYIARRLFQPMPEGALSSVLSPASTLDAFELGSEQFPPVSDRIEAHRSLLTSNTALPRNTRSGGTESCGRKPITLGRSHAALSSRPVDTDQRTRRR